ncbi:MAG: hypothetical protein D6704_03310 [Nitrospirae bacterium]|nr:MAG: hypothetical protein D6704_03310 [Nitrospirota bacterium]
MGSGGLLIIAAACSLFTRLPTHPSLSISPALSAWWYGVALVCLLSGALLGVAMGWARVLPDELGWIKVAHSHLVVLGFVFLTVLGLMQGVLPTLLDAPLSSPSLTRTVFCLLPFGVLLLISGLVLSKVLVQLAGGLVLGCGLLLCAWNVVRTWKSATQPAPPAFFHLLVSMGILLMMVVSGLLLAVNLQWTPPPVRVGQLHLLAYSHVFFIGFVLQSAFGLVMVALPLMISKRHVKHHKKRRLFHAALVTRMERWSTLQLWSVNLGMLGLIAGAALVWWVPLKSPWIPLSAWISAFLLVIPIGLFTLKVVRLLGSTPEH